jgi:hypothetical protein
MRRPPANHHAITLFRRLAHDFFGGFASTVGIHHLHPLRVQRTFEAAAQERSEEAFSAEGAALLTLLYRRTIAAQDARDLGGKQRDASSAAMSAAPLPYSRFIVVTLIIKTNRQPRHQPWDHSCER